MTKPTHNTGYFVISLDLELYWGMFDKVSLESYGAAILGVHTVVPKMLQLFKEYQAHTTWAAVGFVTYPERAALMATVSQMGAGPQYSDTTLSAYTHIESARFKETDERYYFGPDIITQILATPGQELGSHTFSHYYALEEGQTSDDFKADCIAQTGAFSRYDVVPRSLIFPRNQVAHAHLKEAAMAGIEAYRGTTEHVFYHARNERAQTRLWRRGARFLDRYIPLSGNRAYVLPRKASGLPQNVPASLQLLPYSPKLSFLEDLKLRRIKRDMTRAAKKGEVYHLWWHPHNFGRNQEENLAQLQQLLGHMARLRERYGFQSVTMTELATIHNHTEHA